MKVSDELAEALKEIIDGYEEYADTGFFDLFCHGECITKALEALKNYEDSKND
jgi:hypothetical protein